MGSDILYYERQRMWLWAILLFPINTPFIYGLIKQLIFNQPWSTNPMSNAGLIIVSVLMFLFTMSMFTIKLETIVTKDGVYVRFFPFIIRYKFYPWEKINKAEIKKYSPLKEYGGWGFRFGFNGSMAFNVRGNIGLELVLNNGRKILIGTNKQQALEEVIAKLRK